MGETSLHHVASDALAPWDIGDSDRLMRSVKSAERTLALFELFALHQAPLTIGQIAQLLDIPQPSVSMLTRNLVKLGYIEHDRAARTYLPTIRIMLLGSWIHRRFDSERDLQATLDNLLESTGETVALGIQNGIYSQYVSAQLPTDPHRMEVQSGHLRPITCTAIGRALLSIKSDMEINMLVRRCNAEVLSDHLRIPEANFRAIIDTVRANGFAETRGDMTPGYGAIAVIAPAPTGSIPMAICVGGPIERIEAKRTLIIDALLQLSCDFADHRRGPAANAA
jgi:DNA-binding IclR family transcriptional regulator